VGLSRSKRTSVSPRPGRCARVKIRKRRLKQQNGGAALPKALVGIDGLNLMGQAKSVNSRLNAEAAVLSTQPGIQCVKRNCLRCNSIGKEVQT